MVKFPSAKSPKGPKTELCIIHSEEGYQTTRLRAQKADPWSGRKFSIAFWRARLGANGSKHACRPPPPHVSTQTPRTLRIWPRGKSATAERMAAFPFRSEHVLGVPPCEASGPSSFSTEITRPNEPENRTVPYFPPSRMVGSVPFWEASA